MVVRFGDRRSPRPGFPFIAGPLTLIEIPKGVRIVPITTGWRSGLSSSRNLHTGFNGPADTGEGLPVRCKAQIPRSLQAIRRDIVEFRQESVRDVDQIDRAVGSDRGYPG